AFDVGVLTASKQTQVNKNSQTNLFHQLSRFKRFHNDSALKDTASRWRLRAKTRIISRSLADTLGSTKGHNGADKREIKKSVAKFSNQITRTKKKEVSVKFSIRVRSVGKFDPGGEDYFCSIVLAHGATVCALMSLDGEFFPRVGSVVMPSILD